MSKFPHMLVLLLACALAACAGSVTKTEVFVQDDGTLLYFHPDTDPYWMSPAWTASLLKAVQSAMQDPVDASDMAAHDIHGAVKFTYVSGVIEYPDIAQSTGDPRLDKLMLEQVASAQPPAATGPHADEPHEFVLELDMPTPFEAFQSAIYSAIDMQKVFPKNAIMSGSLGDSTVGFDYLDGKASNIVLVQSSKDKDLDKASLTAVTRAEMPAAPPAYAGKLRHMEAIICYSLHESPIRIMHPCPVGRNVIQVIGTRIRR